MRSPIQQYIDELHRDCLAIDDGEVATYIPELAKADPNWFAIAVATADGEIYEAGDSTQPFTIQSISKPFIYGMALQDLGLDRVLKKIGVEPTGDAFNSISLEPGSGRPLNPMINAGAIAATSLVAGHSPEDKLARMLAVLSIYAGRELSIDTSVFESEATTGHRNRAIGHMLRNFDILTEDPTDALTRYFQQCSVSVTCRDLAFMAATLANRGAHPLTGETAIRDDLIPSVLSVMTTCGMYDYAGEWTFWVGMPAKSGVAGGVLAVLPGRLGIGVFSPRLDAHGNSVRGLEVCKRLARHFQLHSLDAARSPLTTVRAAYDATRVRSKRARTPAVRALLADLGSRVRVLELQGDIGFAGAEAAIRRIVKPSDPLTAAVIDFSRVTRVGDAVPGLIVSLLGILNDAGRTMGLVIPEGHRRVLRRIEELAAQSELPLKTFPDLDRALEWAEDRVLAEANSTAAASTDWTELSGNAACREFSDEQTAQLSSVLSVRDFERGQLLVRRGEPADEMFLLASGRVTVLLELRTGQIQRLAAFSAGMFFGDLAWINGSTRTADVRADTAVRCFVLSADSFQQLVASHPETAVAFLRNLLANAASTVGQLNQELAAIAARGPSQS